MVNNKVSNYLLYDNFNTFSSNLNQTLSSVIANKVYQDSLITNITNTLLNYLQTTTLNNYIGSTSSIFGTVVIYIDK